MDIKQKIRNTMIGEAIRNIYYKYKFIRLSFSWIWIRVMLSIPSKHFRRFYLNCYNGVKIGDKSPIYGGFEWWRGEFVIGNGCNIGFHNHIDCRNGVYIGNNVCLASRVTIWTKHHDYNDLHFCDKGGRVVVGDYVWLCSHCIILPNVTIGEGAVVASGAVVTKDVEPWTVVGGIPAKPISKREKKDYDYRPGECWIPFM